MKERTLHNELNKFNVRKYIEMARKNGRLGNTTQVNNGAVEIYEQIRDFRSTETFVSRDFDAVLSLAERVLFSDWFLANNPVPRYPAYTNIHVLNWVLGTNQRQPYNQVWQHCWVAIEVLIHDLLVFETDTLAHIFPWQQNNVNSDAILDRVQKLHKLQTTLKIKKRGFNRATISFEIPETWDSYIGEHRLDTLRYLTAFPQTMEHDEYLFLRTIHLSECCFWGVLTSVIASMDAIKKHNYSQGVICLEEAVAFAQILVPLFQAFRTMSPDYFTAFRDATGNASAIQSRTYQMMQIFTQGMDARKVAMISTIPEVVDLLHYDHPDFVDLRKLLVSVSENTSYRIDKLLYKAEELDKALYAWRCIHLGIAREYLPQSVEGTGGTHGSPYLEAHYRRRIFPTGGGFARSQFGQIPKQFLVPVLSRIN